MVYRQDTTEVRLCGVGRTPHESDSVVLTGHHRSQILWCRQDTTGVRLCGVSRIPQESDSVV